MPFINLNWLRSEKQVLYPRRLNSCLLWFCFVAGLISPWNLPLYLLTWKIAPAIACGNTVVAKPSEMTSVTAWMMCKLLEKAGKPRSMLVRWNGVEILNLCTIFCLQKSESPQRLWERLFVIAECCIEEQKTLPVLIQFYLPTPVIAQFFHYLLMKNLHVLPFSLLRST